MTTQTTIRRKLALRLADMSANRMQRLYRHGELTVARRRTEMAHYRRIIAAYEATKAPDA